MKLYIVRVAEEMEKQRCIYEILRRYIEDIEKMDEAVLVVRRKLTKKEYKILLYGCDEDSVDGEIAERLNLDKVRYLKLYNSALKKITRLAEYNEFNL